MASVVVKMSFPRLIVFVVNCALVSVYWAVGATTTLFDVLSPMSGTVVDVIVMAVADVAYIVFTAAQVIAPVIVSEVAVVSFKIKPF